MFAVSMCMHTPLPQSHIACHPPPQVQQIASLDHSSSSNTASHPRRSQYTLNNHKSESIRFIRKEKSSTHPSNTSPTNSPNSRQRTRAQHPTLEQNLQRSHIINNNSPADGASTAGQIVPPDQQHEREQLGEARHQQRGADDGRVRVVREQPGQRPRQAG